MGSSGTVLQSFALAPACSSLRRLPRRGSTCDQPPPTLDPTPPFHPPPVAVRGSPSLSPASLESLPHGATVQEHSVSVSPLQCPPADALLHVCVVGGSVPGQDVHELDCDGDDVTMNESDETTSMAGGESGHCRHDPPPPRCEDDKSRPSGRGRKRSRRLSFSTRRHRQSGRKARPARLGRCPGGESDPSSCRTLASCGEDPSELPHPPDPPYPRGDGAPRPLSLLGCPHCGRQSGGSGRRARMLRWAARCAALVVLVVCGGVLASRTILPLQHRGPVTDHKIDQEWTDTSANTLLMGVRINPVPLQEFKRHLRTARNPYDVFRIFFNKLDLSDAMIGELLTARPIDSVLNNKHKKSTEDEYSELPYSDHADYNEELAMAYGHMLEVEDSPLSECKKPRPEILHVEDELHPERRLFPECTIVNRCKNVSGCCGSPDMECGPKRIRIIQKAFFVLDDVGSEQVRPSDELVTLVPIVDHVECECRQSKRLPECNQDCPFPFTKMRPHVHCTCDCPDRPHEQPNRCHDVKEGRIPLDHDDLARIKSGQYLRPQCRIGVFDVKTGYCPPVPRDYDFFERSRGRMQHDEHNAKQKKSRRHRTK